MDNISGILNVKPQQSFGFEGSLFILPFDHRSSFEKGLFDINGRMPTSQEKIEISRYKMIIYDGFVQAVSAGIPKKSAGILVDEEYGTEILREAKNFGCWTACCVEKSGQAEFEFEYGNEFKEHILNIRPDFVKVLVRYNPEGDAELNKRQAERLKILSDFCHVNDLRFMFEILVPATQAQLNSLEGDLRRYDRELRPDLMSTSIMNFQAAGVEADVWKVEGVHTKTDYEKIAKQALTNGRKDVALIVLGHGENQEAVKLWLSVAAQVPAFCGFAIGRTVWEDSLKKVKAGELSAPDASKAIAEEYRFFYDLWITAKALEGQNNDK